VITFNVPLPPELVVPDIKVMIPETPDVPPFDVRMITVPLVEGEPMAEFMLTVPPV
jgi:hypothetical protein